MKVWAKNRWVHALRSGKYEQGAGHLTRIDADGKRRDCCLGVLCDLAYRDGAVTAEERRLPVGIVTEYAGQDAVLPQKVAEWAGLIDASPEVEVPIDGPDSAPASTPLTELNDEAGLSFARIADLIEEQL